FQSLEQEFPVFRMPQRRAKRVYLSPLWSYTGIGGMYFPFFVEANINTDVPHSGMPATILHELAHTIGFAREEDAEFAAFLAGIYHPDPDFVYSSWFLAYRYLSRTLSQVDRDAWIRLNKRVSEDVKRDIDAVQAYWSRFRGPVQSVSRSVNHAYLRSNMQKDGVMSYGRVLDLILGLHEDQRLPTAPSDLK
ncbi:DUF3810 domain-containing protein, partial [Balneolaceae bacterium ANBcel3]|nr:DUF3810 domain-containing protein [Balneolaceae bacterium ANBcel3]